MKASDKRLRAAWQIAKDLEDTGFSTPDVCMILATAMGVFIERQDGSHREMLPLAEAVNVTAQLIFDVLRADRDQKAGHA